MALPIPNKSSFRSIITYCPDWDGYSSSSGSGSSGTWTCYCADTKSTNNHRVNMQVHWNPNEYIAVATNNRICVAQRLQVAPTPVPVILKADTDPQSDLQSCRGVCKFVFWWLCCAMDTIASKYAIPRTNKLAIKRSFASVADQEETKSFNLHLLELTDYGPHGRS